MFTDMVGYSALSEADEQLALKLLDEQRAILRGMFSKHGGREIKNMADGFFVEFASVVDAVRSDGTVEALLAALPEMQALAAD